VRSKALDVEDLTQGIEQLQDFVAKVEDLGREGFPYLEGARARTELQFRECIKRAFGDKSPEFQTYRNHKLSSDTKQTASLVRKLIATLEEKKLELQRLKPAMAEEATASEPARTRMTLVPPSAQPAQVTITPAPPAAPPVTMAIPSTTNVEMSASSTAPANVATRTATPAPPSPEPVTPPQPAGLSTDPKPQRAPMEPISSLFRTQETRPQPPIPQQVQEPSPVPAPAPQPTPSLSTTQEVPARRFSTTQEVPARQFSTTQEVPARPQTTTPNVSRVSVSPEMNHLNVAKTLCQRFHFVARQLRLRGEHRSTLNVEDECDVQDLLHALLRLQFDDINTDEWTPAYSNGAPRTTFLLNQDRLAIVVKKTRTGLSAKELMEQVRTDIERYRARGRCTNLFCFVYDPEGRIGNPRGLESDLASTSDNFTVDVLVAPK